MDQRTSADGPVADAALPACGCEVQVREADSHDHMILTIRGVLASPWTEAELRQVLRNQLLDRGRVVVDLRQATVPWGPVVQLFPTALAEVGGWPLGRLVLARPHPLTARILQASRVHLIVPLASSLGRARALLDVLPPRVARDHPLPCDRTPPALARSVVASAWEDWQLDDGLRDAATAVATELVSNAVEHARTTCVLHLQFDQRRVQIAVRDGSPLTAGGPHIAVTHHSGYGLLIIQGLCRRWSITPHADGKTVWALVDAGRDPLI